jgi:hypothetical protein
MARRFMDEIRLDPKYWIGRLKTIAVSRTVKKIEVERQSK